VGLLAAHHAISSMFHVLLRNYVVANSILDQVSVGFEAQALHDPVLMEGDRSGLKVENTGDFLHRHSLGE